MVWFSSLDRFAFRAVNTYVLRKRTNNSLTLIHNDRKTKGIVHTIGTNTVICIKKAPNRPVIIYSHGRGEDLGFMMKHKLMEMLSDYTNCTVYAYEYPGYGYQHFSEVSSSQTILQLLELYTMLANKHQRIILYGYSMGTGVTMQALKNMMQYNMPLPESIILEGAFTSLLGTNIPIKFKLPLAAGIDLFKTYKVLPSVTIPLYFIHGTDDQICPVNKVIRMANKFKSLILPGRDHFTVRRDRKYAPYIRKITK